MNTIEAQYTLLGLLSGILSIIIFMLIWKMFKRKPKHSFDNIRLLIAEANNEMKEANNKLLELNKAFEELENV